MSVTGAEAQHRFSLKALSPEHAFSGGFRLDVTSRRLPALKGMALSLLKLEPQGFREPHWHPNVHELSYCLSGQALMTIFSPGNQHHTFKISAGDIAFVPMGSLHHIENMGQTPFEMLVCFDDALPEDIEFSSGIGVMPEHVLGATVQGEESLFKGVRRGPTPLFIGKRDGVAPMSPAYLTSRFKYGLRDSLPRVQTEGGLVKMSNGFFFPVLENLAIYYLHLDEKGIREPHWHPNASELNYLVKGRARIRLLSPGGAIDTFDMEAGDMSFLPRGYPHYIENIGDGQAEFAIFFNHAFPSDLGFSGCLGAYSDEILAPTCGLPQSQMAKIPKLQTDLLVVKGRG